MLLRKKKKNELSNIANYERSTHTHSHSHSVERIYNDTMLNAEMNRHSYVSHFQLFHFEEFIFQHSACMQNAVDKAIFFFFSSRSNGAKDKNYVHIIESAK